MSFPETQIEAGLLNAVRRMRCEDWYFRDDLFRDDDVWLASYPRSGSHFVRFILVSARHFLKHRQFPSDLSGMKTIPDIHGRRLEFAEESPRILKTHFPRDPRYRRVIHLIRDPRDVIVSYFHYSKGLPHLFSEPVSERLKLPEFVDLFLRGKVWPGDVREHAASYSRSSGGIEYSCIRYESLLTEPRREYPRLLSAAGIHFPDESLDALIGHTSFANMRRLHQPETARAGMVETNPVHILRSGTAGQHAQVLRERTRRQVESAMAAYMKDYGYA
jgi:hypothetical protein